MANGSRITNAKEEYEAYGVPLELALKAAKAYDKQEAEEPLSEEETNTLRQANAIVRNNQPRYYD